MARSDPRRATIIGLAGIIVGIAMIAIVLLANNAGTGHSTTKTSSATFHVGSPQSVASRIAGDRTPLFFNDTATGSRPLVVQHIGDDPQKGWFAFDAAVGTCALTWHSESSDFTDCSGRRFPADGAGTHQYPVTVDKDDLTVDLSVDATTTTSPITSDPPHS